MRSADIPRAHRWSRPVWIKAAQKNLSSSGGIPSFRNPQSTIRNALVLIRTIAHREIIVAADESARSQGIRPGMTLGEARALCAHVSHASHDPIRDQKSLEALGRWMMRFSPVVALLPLPSGEGWGEG
ncbi:MAG: hypothetical protein ACREJC_21970, partial [Tepidisphaeraceae bacterium]